MNVAYSLFGLEDKITHQMKHDWSDPSLVTTELERIFFGISHSQNIGSESNTLSENDLEILDQLSDGLRTYQLYPLETLDQYSDLTEENKIDFEKIGKSLREAGFDSNEIEEFHYWDKKSLIEKFSELTKSLES